ncbi:MAG: hypothetical protein GWO10_16315 [candidate division Zixibacteria bacterium]|nr:hypothetical protein [Gammaproteobacteria bacterium]NIR25697.1 hypothetical protein [Gammaproteobacteria bacterium]NIR65290.1 hypothetical protein [candidate division Zixibacteria bacterium]NIS52334.1 hypothetical protein [Phycisphaerae bacterium]NIX02133.1 hypothetical protein [Phycisphaerae bacterium]
MCTMTKDPNAYLDYKWDWDSWLASLEIISTATFVLSSGLTVGTYDITDAGKSVTAWISGGTDTSAEEATCRITTDAGRIDDRTIILEIRER